MQAFRATSHNQAHQLIIHLRAEADPRIFLKGGDTRGVLRGKGALCNAPPLLTLPFNKKEQTLRYD